MCFFLLRACLYSFIAVCFAALVLFWIWIAGSLAQFFSSLTVAYSSSNHSFFSCFSLVPLQNSLNLRVWTDSSSSSDFSLSTRKRLLSVMYALHILALNVMTTSMWSESIFAPLCAFRSMSSEKCLPSIIQLSIWLKVRPSGECQVCRWIRLCLSRRIKGLKNC
jgi:hypothetical protein